MPYTRAYPALTALSLSQLDYVVPGILEGAELNYDHVTSAESQYSFRKCLHAANQATLEEVQTAARRCDELKSEFAVGNNAEVLVGLGTLRQTCTRMLDMLQVITTDVQSLKTDVQSLKTDVQSLKTDVQSLKNRQDYEDATSFNRRFAVKHDSPIRAVPHKETGALPGPDVWFPTDKGTLFAANSRRINELADFYGLPGATEKEKRAVLYAYLAIQL